MILDSNTITNIIQTSGGGIPRVAVRWVRNLGSDFDDIRIDALESLNNWLLETIEKCGAKTKVKDVAPIVRELGDWVQPLLFISETLDSWIKCSLENIADFKDFSKRSVLEFISWIRLLFFCGVLTGNKVSIESIVARLDDWIEKEDNVLVKRSVNHVAENLEMLLE